MKIDPSEEFSQNLARFSERAVADRELAGRVRQVHLDAAGQIEDEILALAAEQGLPFTREEYRETLAARAAELSDEQLELVSGGVWDATGGNICLSIFTIGLGCLGRAIESAIGNRGGHHGVDECQGQKKT